MLVNIGRQGGQTRGDTMGIFCKRKKFFGKNAIKTEFRRNFKVEGCKVPTDLGPCLGMIVGILKFIESTSLVLLLVPVSYYL